jgi:nucleotide-binding universal stress UspA family protein
MLASQEDAMSTTGTRPARVVVGYDASTSAKLAVGWAAAEATRRGLPLTVIYAADYTGLVGGPLRTSVRVPGLSVDEAQRIAERGADLARAGHPELDVHAATFIGSAGTVLIKESDNAELLVVGNRGHGDLAGLLLGSVAARVAASARCPVRPVVVGVDGSEVAGTALRVAVKQAAATGARLRIVSAWVPTTAGRWNRTAREEAEGVVADAVAKVAELAPDLPVEARVRGGDPAAVVLDAACDAGLLVVGARGRGSLASLFLGSVSHGVVHGAHAPVMVVRARPTASAAPDSGEGADEEAGDQVADGTSIPTGLV